MHFKIIALAALLGATPVADAAQVTLNFRLVVTNAEETLLPVENVAGRTLGAYEAVGVAVFEDGRLAFKRFVHTDDGTETEGTGHGCRARAPMPGRRAPAPSKRRPSRGRGRTASTAPSRWRCPGPDRQPAVSARAALPDPAKRPRGRLTRQRRPE